MKHRDVTEEKKRRGAGWETIVCQRDIHVLHYVLQLYLQTVLPQKSFVIEAQMLIVGWEIIVYQRALIATQLVTILLPQTVAQAVQGVTMDLI